MKHRGQIGHRLKVVALKTALALWEDVLSAKNDLNLNNNLVNRAPNVLKKEKALEPAMAQVQVKQCTYFPLVSATEMALFGKLSWPNLTFLTRHLASYGSPSPSLVCFPLT
jgi:hypothetical protein